MSESNLELGEKITEKITWKQAVKQKLVFAVDFVVTAVVFATALATVITILGFGLGILQHGTQNCILAVQQAEYRLLLYSSCSCAWAEIILLLAAIPILKVATPRLLKHYVSVYRWRK